MDARKWGLPDQSGIDGSYLPGWQWRVDHGVLCAAWHSRDAKRALLAARARD